MSRTDLPQTANVPGILKCWYGRYYDYLFLSWIRYIVSMRIFLFKSTVS